MFLLCDCTSCEAKQYHMTYACGVSWPSGSEHRTQALVFLISRVCGLSLDHDTYMYVLKAIHLITIISCCVQSFRWDVKPFRVLCKPSALTIKRRGSPRCSGFDCATAPCKPFGATVGRNHTCTCRSQFSNHTCSSAY